MNSYIFAFDDVSKASTVTMMEMVSQASLVPVNKQLSCHHIERRFQAKLDLIKEMVSVKEDLMDVNGSLYVDFVQYMNHVDSIDLKPIVLDSVFEVEGVLLKNDLPFDLNDIDIIAGLNGSSFEQSFQGDFLSIPFVYENRSDSVFLKAKINAVDICNQKTLDLIFYSGCSKDLFQFDQCETYGICLENRAYDIRSCEKSHIVRMSLTNIAKKMGRRASVLSRRRR